MQSKIQSQYQRIGADYLRGQRSFQSHREKSALNFIKKSLPPLKGKKLLDVGCGDGSDVVQYHRWGAKEVYGIDISSYMISQARANKNISVPQRVITGSIEGTSYKNEYFDIIVSRFMLHYLFTFDLAYKEIARILKKAGTLIFIAHHPLRDLSLQRKKIYGKKENVSLSLFDDAVSVKFPTHTFQDYFSETFFSHFQIVDFIEEEYPDEYLDLFHSPGYMGIKAVKI